jgi:hypothetical protein
MKAAREFDVSDLWNPRQSLPTGGTLRKMAARCGRFWDCPDLARRAAIGYNPRMRTSLGQAHLEQGCIQLNPRLLVEHPEELVETLVHELAHLVVYWRYGPVRPHGREFFTLMRAVNLSGKATHALNVDHLRRPRIGRKLRRIRRVPRPR